MLARPIRTCLCAFFAFTAAIESAALDWVSKERQGDILSFFVASPAQVQRYDVTTRTWLTPIVLPTSRGSLTAGTVDADGYYIAYDRAVYRYSTTGTDEIPILNANNSVHGLFTDENLLLINHSSYLYARWVSVNKTNNTVIATLESYIDSTYGCSIARAANRLFGTTQGISPADVVYVDYTDAGTFTKVVGGPAHGDYPVGTRTWVFPSGTRVTDTTGHIYNSGDLTHALSFGTTIDDLAFSGNDVPIVLKGSTLTSYSNALLLAGSTTLSAPAKSIIVSGDSIVAFRPTTDSNIATEIVALSSIKAPTPGLPVNPRGLAFTPEQVFTDNSGTVHLFSKAHQTIFRWSPTTQDYTTGIPLVGSPSFVAYSASSNCIYTAYVSGLVRKIDLADATLAEVPFAQLPAAPLGVATAGSYFFACDESGAWATHYTYSATGQLVTSKDWNYYSRAYIWNDANQKMYFFRDDTSPNDLLWEEINANGTAYPSLAAGALGNVKDSPLHTSTGFTHPIRLSPNGDFVALGSGMIHDGRTLERLSSGLANEFQDATWIGEKLYSFRTISNTAQLQEWTPPNFGLGLVLQIPGTARHLLAIPNNKLVAILYGSAQVPVFYVLNQQLGFVAPPELQTPTGLTATILSATNIQLSWNAVPGGESYVIERSTPGVGSWTTIATNTVGITTYSDSTVQFGSTYTYRVTAKSGTLLSTPTAAISIATTLPAQPTLDASAETVSSIRLNWPATDRATSYQISRQIGPSGSWSTLNTVSSTTFTYLDTGLSSGTTYSYRLVAINVIGSSAPSATVSVTTPLTPPDTPYFYSTYAQSALSVYLSWSTPSRASSYRIERGPSSNGPWQTVATPSAPNTYFTDVSVSPSTVYYYRVIALNAAGESSPSTTQSATTPALVAPSAPANLTGRALSLTEIELTWSDTSLEFGYRVERRIGENAWVEIASLAADITHYVDNTATTGDYYNYRVVAHNTGGSSASAVVYLRAAASGDLFREDFDPGAESVWASLRGGTVRTGPNGFYQGNALWMGGDGTRSAELLPLDVSQGGTISFRFRAGNSAVDGEAIWEDSDSGESVVLQYSLNGNSWTTMTTLDTLPPAGNTWSVVNIPIPSGARTTATRFRWIQAAHSGANFDTWALDDVSLSTLLPDLPETPGFIMGMANSSRAIALSWSPAPRATSYVVQRRTSNTTWQDIGTSGFAQTFYTDCSAEPATLYSYRVVARNASGDSSPSGYTIASTWSTIAEWRFQNYGTINNEGIAAALEDNGSGVPNLLRYAFNLSADDRYYQVNVSGDFKGLPSVQFASNTGRLQVAFIRRRAVRNPGITYTVEFSNNLTDWAAGGTEALAVPIDLDFEFVVWEDDMIFSGPATSRFARVKVTE